MDAEAAETYLRRVVEAALRDHRDDRFQAQERVQRVARALVAVGAIERAVAEAVESDVELALLARTVDDPSKPRFRRFISGRHMTYAGVGSSVSGATVAASSASSVSAHDWAVPLDAVLEVDTDELRGELCLLAYRRSESGTRLAFVGTLEEKRPRLPGRRPHAAFSAFRHLSAEDDQGNAYAVRFNGGGGDAGWSGEFVLRPDAPSDIRWLRISGEDITAVRVDLAGEAPVPEITVTESPLSPGEQYLMRLASGPMGHGFDREALPEITDALRAAGALPAGSPVPGQLAAFLHGTVPPGGLPERWRLARENEPVPARAVAGLAVVLPELDGMRIALLGVYTGQRGSGVSVHATGVQSHEDGLPALWIRDRAGWHVTRAGSSSLSEEELTADLMIEPPLVVGDWIEVVVAGNATEILARVPVRWRTL